MIRNIIIYVCDFLDTDGDGWPECDGYLDCDDGNPDVNPDAQEICDEIDWDCTGDPHDRDADGDGFTDASCGGTDCDDTDPEVYPGAEEICDGKDSDCDGSIPEDEFADEDGDGFPLCGDCDDTNPDINPGVYEGVSGSNCGDGRDNDCDGLVDIDAECTIVCSIGFTWGEEGETCGGTMFLYEDEEGSCCISRLCPDIYGNWYHCDYCERADRDNDGYNGGQCEGNDCNDTDPEIYPGAEEVCDAIDWDCSGDPLDKDDDGDGHIVLDPVCMGDDCDDADPMVYSGAEELCDGKDNDCDGSIPADEVDDDGDSWRICAGDCDDSNPGVNPGADEDCDNGIDDDCDGLVDYPDDPDCVWTLDLDASHEGGTLSMDFTLRALEPVIWSTSLILTWPTIQRIPLWSVPLPFIDPSIDIPIAFPCPSLGLIWITTGLYTETGAQALDYELLDTGDDIQIQSNLPDTGVDLCFDDQVLIPCPAPGWPFYGQDAQYVTNPMSFTDHPDGTVTDNVTGLMWQHEDDDARDWFEAIDYCEALYLAGHADWRLPDEYELQGIVDYGRFEPAIDTIYFPGTASSDYWSSSTYAGHSLLAWAVQFNTGHVYSYDKDDHVYVRCVRGESTEQSFTDHGDGTVSDNVTGLMWQQEDDDWARDWEGALAYCEAIELAGHTDWRLPDVKELRSTVDNTRYDPAIDTTYFPGTGSYYYWSSSTLAYFTVSAWGIPFIGGSVYGNDKGGDGYVRCVR